MCIWSVEADIFDFDENDIFKVLYVNAPVRRFLSAKDSMGIAGCKGMGKTFLLKAKRIEMQKNNNGSILLLPKNNLLDTSAPIILDRMHDKLLSSYDNWISLWLSCISIYILSLPEVYSDDIAEEINDLPIDVQILINKKNTGVFNVLNRILDFKDKAKLNLFIHSSSLLFDIMKLINKPIALFVDKLEEPFNRGYYHIPGNSPVTQGRTNSSIWTYSQVAFVEAVYRIYSARHHIKIYYSIRKEAIIGAEAITIEYLKLTSRIIDLQYTMDDLKKMFYLYIANEDDDQLCFPRLKHIQPEKSFVGFDVILHRTGVEETVWAYMYRHSLQRPRDIMEMSYVMNHQVVNNPTLKYGDQVERIRLFRRWVNEASTSICRTYIRFLEPFMSRGENIRFVNEIMEFTKYLNTNVFTLQSMKYFCKTVNKKDIACNELCGECEGIHFFSTLYNIGLLGYIYKSKSENGYKNKINHIGDSVFNFNRHSLPKATLYYAHPGFSNIIQIERELAEKTYHPSYLVLNSADIFVDEERIRLLNDSVNSYLGNMNTNSVFLCSTGHDCESLRLRIKQRLEDAGYKVFAYETPGFPQMENISEIKKNISYTHDHCIDVMLSSCKHLIYIFTGRFGGKYHGEKYIQYYEKEKNVITETPSISFMEYLVAKNHSKNVKVYVEDKVEIARGEYLQNESHKSYKSKIVDDIRVFKQLGYFNALGNATWYDTYSHEQELEEFIKTHFPILTN